MPYVCFAMTMAVVYAMGRAGWRRGPVVLFAVLILVGVALILRWATMPSGLDRVAYLGGAVLLCLPALAGGALGLWLGRRR